MGCSPKPHKTSAKRRRGQGLVPGRVKGQSPLAGFGGLKPAAASGTGACRPLCGKKAGGTSGTTRSGESRDYVGSPEDEGGRNVWKRKGALARLFRFPDSCPNVPHREAIQEKSSQGAKRYLMGTLLKAAMILKTASVPRSPAILTIESSPFPQTVHIYTGVSRFPKTVHIDFRQTGFSPFDIDGYLPSLRNAGSTAKARCFLCLGDNLRAPFFLPPRTFPGGKRKFLPSCQFSLPAGLTSS